MYIYKDDFDDLGDLALRIQSWIWCKWIFLRLDLIGARYNDKKSQNGKYVLFSRRPWLARCLFPNIAAHKLKESHT